MSGIDYFALMRDVTELHVRELGVTALSNDPGPLAANREIDQSLEARRLICGLSQGDTALMRDVDSQEVASPQSLGSPSGYGVSGVTAPGIIEWNDVPERTFAEVKELFEKAIAAENAGGK